MAGHEPLERAAAALAQHRDRGDEEHQDQREQASDRRADAAERLRLPVEHEPQQRDERGRDDEDQPERTVVRRSWAVTRLAVARVTRVLMIGRRAR